MNKAMQFGDLPIGAQFVFIRRVEEADWPLSPNAIIWEKCGQWRYRNAYRSAFDDPNWSLAIGSLTTLVAAVAFDCMSRTTWKE